MRSWKRDLREAWKWFLRLAEKRDRSFRWEIDGPLAFKSRLYIDGHDISHMVTGVRVEATDLNKLVQVHLSLICQGGVYIKGPVEVGNLADVTNLDSASVERVPSRLISEVAIEGLDLSGEPSISVTTWICGKCRRSYSTAIDVCPECGPHPFGLDGYQAAWVCTHCDKIHASYSHPEKCPDCGRDRPDLMASDNMEEDR